MQVKIVIPSRGRQDRIGKMSLSVAPSAIVCVDESEVDAYAEFVNWSQILPHPRLHSLGAIRNWIIDNVPDKIIFMMDDDIISAWSFVSRRPRIYTDPAVVTRIIENAAEIAEGIGAGYFGFNQTADPISFRAYDPICFHNWVGTAVGVIGKDIHYDTKLSLRDDFDFSLQQLLKKRIIFRDNRFHFESQKRLKSIGGNGAFRSSERETREIDHLTKKWGRYVHFGMGGRGGRSVKVTAATVNVGRRQP